MIEFESIPHIEQENTIQESEGLPTLFTWKEKLAIYKHFLKKGNIRSLKRLWKKEYPESELRKDLYTWTLETEQKINNQEYGYIKRG